MLRLPDDLVAATGGATAAAAAAAAAAGTLCVYVYSWLPNYLEEVVLEQFLPMVWVDLRGR